MAVPKGGMQNYLFSERVIMTITSTSTIDQVIAQFNDNLVWEGSPFKAVLALEAVRWLLVNRAQATNVRGRSWNWTQLETMEGKLASYVDANSTTSKANRATFTRGKMLL